MRVSKSEKSRLPRRVAIVPRNEPENNIYRRSMLMKYHDLANINNLNNNSNIIEVAVWGGQTTRYSHTGDVLRRDGEARACVLRKSDGYLRLKPAWWQPRPGTRACLIREAPEADVWRQAMHGK